AAASAQRAVVDQQISQEVIQIQANTSAKIVETNTQLTERQTALTAYGEEQSRQPHTIADEEAARAQGEIEAAAGEAERVGDTVASRYSEPDSKVAAREVAAESAADMREKPPSIADGLRAKADEFANQYMEFANGVNTQIEGARPQLESALNDASLTAVAGIQATRSSTIQAIDDRLRIDLQALNQGEALAVQQTQAAGEIAITQTQSEAQRFVGEVDTASEMLISNVDATIAEASVVVSAEPSPYLPGIEDVIEAARAAVQTSSAQGRDALRNRVDSNLPALEEIVAEFASEASELTRTAQDSAAEVLDRGVGAIQAVVDRRNQTAQQQVMSLTTQQQEMVDQALGQIDQAIEQARSRMRSVNDAIRTRVHEAAEESITEAKKPLTDPLESRADSAADRADDNVILGILQAIGDIVVGFIIILAIAVVVAAVFGLTLGGALLIVGGIALVVGVVMAYQARSEQLQREGIQAAGGFIFLLALSDATGITGVGEAIHGVDVVTGQRLRGRERARRGTLGLVTAVALVFGVRGALKGPSGGWTRPTSIFRGPGNITWGALVKNVKGVGKDLAAAWQATKRGIESIRERFRGRTQRSGEGPPPEETAPQEQPRTEEPVQETRTTPSPEETTGRRSGPEETPTAARVRRLNELARDPDHGNAVSDSSRAEAEVALGLEERGELPGPVRRPVRGDGHSGDFVDGQGGDWDVKAPRSRQNLIDEIRSRARAANRPEPRIDPARPIRGEFDIARTMTEIRGELAAGEGVIIDTRGLNPTDLANLRAAIQQEGLGSRVKFYP
ncbi:MAG TPA: hypothetical protein VL334_09985, partial [Anaerolineae bacterium]|nr:hypothetical protein [Anaerolineae bacterium]